MGGQKKLGVDLDCLENLVEENRITRSAEEHGITWGRTKGNGLL